MQIFSPYADFNKIANCLDNKRLNKQKVEICQILKVIQLKEMAKGWKNHPAVKMVRGHEAFFINYGLVIANKCISKGWKDTLKPKIQEFFDVFGTKIIIPDFWWLDSFHSSHRAALLFKNFEHYKQFNWNEKPEIKYVWPV